MDPVLVIGNGMVGHPFVGAGRRAGIGPGGGGGGGGPPGGRPGPPSGGGARGGAPPRGRGYDRVHLWAVSDGTTADELTLGDADLYGAPGVELVLGDPVVALDTAAHTATTAAGRTIASRTCVLATGSAPFVPPIPGTD